MIAVGPTEISGSPNSRPTRSLDELRHPKFHRIERPDRWFQPTWVATGPDGNLWFAEQHATTSPSWGRDTTLSRWIRPRSGSECALRHDDSSSARHPHQQWARSSQLRQRRDNRRVPFGLDRRQHLQCRGRVGFQLLRGCHVDPSTTYYQSLGNIEFKTWSGASGRPDQQTLNVGLRKGVYVTCGWAAIKTDLMSPQIVGSVVTFSATSPAARIPIPFPLRFGRASKRGWM